MCRRYCQPKDRRAADRDSTDAQPRAGPRGESEAAFSCDAVGSFSSLVGIPDAHRTRCMQFQVFNKKHAVSSRRQKDLIPNRIDVGRALGHGASTRFERRVHAQHDGNDARAASAHLRADVSTAAAKRCIAATKRIAATAHRAKPVV